MTACPGSQGPPGVLDPQTGATAKGMPTEEKEKLRRDIMELLYMNLPGHTTVAEMQVIGSNIYDLIEYHWRRV